MKVISFIGKGGTGKTTMALLFADILKKNHKTLLLDLDPQASLTFSVLDKHSEVSMLDVYKGCKKIREIIQKKIFLAR